MNGIVGRDRANAMNRNLGTLQKPDPNAVTTGKLQGRTLSFGPVPNQQRKLTLTFSGMNTPIDLVVNGKKISVGQEKPVPMSVRQNSPQEALHQMRQYSGAMRTINKDPQLKEVQSHIGNAQTLIMEMVGLDPATPEELQHLTKSLTDMGDALDKAMESLNSRDLDLCEDIVKNPVPMQRHAIQQLKGMINERLSELTELAPPQTGQEEQPGIDLIAEGKQDVDPEPKLDLKKDVKPEPKNEVKAEPKVKPYTGPTASKVLEGLEDKLKGKEDLAKDPIKGKAAKEILESLDVAINVSKHGLKFLDKAPGNRVEMGKMADDLNKVMLGLAQLKDEISSEMKGNPDFKDVAGDVDNLFDAMKKEVGDRKDALVTATGLNPLSTKAIFHSKSFSTLGAQNMLTEKLVEAKDKLAGLKLENAPKGKLDMAEESVKVLEKAVKFLEDRVEQLRTGNSDETISMKEARSLMGSKGADKGMTPEGLKANVKRLFGVDVDWASEGVRKMLHDEFDMTGDNELGVLQKYHTGLREDGMMELFVDLALRQAGMDVPEDLRTELQNRRYDALNSQAWKPISKDVILRHNGMSHTLKSDIVPQSNLGEHFSDMKGGGVVCHASRHFEHGTTVAVSRLTAPDGTKLFEGVRHGIVNCYGISSQTLHELNPKEQEKLVKNLLDRDSWKKDHFGEPSLPLTINAIKTSKTYRRAVSKEMQAKGSEMRAMDLVATNLLKNDVKFQQALSQAGKQNPVPVDINLNSIALVTPDYTRALKGQSGPGNERKMLRGQMKALAKISGDPQPRELKIKGPDGKETTVLVNVKVNAFNFGVNAGSFGLGGKRIFKFPFVAAWGTQDKYNKKAMDTLIGSKSIRGKDGIGGQVLDWLNSSSAPPKTKVIVRQLAKQVAEMWDSKAHRNAGNEPYKMVSRLALLSSMIDGDTCWNCKSGKDRTGQLDVETKRLAAEIFMSGTVPEPDEKPSDEVKSNRFRMAMDGGNLEIQNYNTGAPGFKLGGVPSLKDQMRLNKDDSRYDYFRGIAGFYGT